MATQSALTGALTQGTPAVITFAPQVMKVLIVVSGTGNCALKRNVEPSQNGNSSLVCGQMYLIQSKMGLSSVTLEAGGSGQTYDICVVDNGY